MRLIQVAAILAVVGSIVSINPSSLNAAVEGGKEADEGEVGLSRSVPSSFSNPASAGPGYCDGNEAYPVHLSEATGGVKTENEQYGFEDQGDVIDIVSIFSNTGDVTLPDTFVIEYVHWKTACVARDNEQLIDGATLDFNWIRVPTPGSVVPDLLAEVRARLRAPDVIWPDRDEENGWLYVNAAMDFRVTPIDTVRAELTVTNVAGSASGWVEARPSTLVFDPGEPNGQPTPCSYADAIAPYSISTPGRCSYRYHDSSAVDPSGTFRTTTAVIWDIDSSAPLTINDGVSSLSESIAVAEVQALGISED